MFSQMRLATADLKTCAVTYVWPMLNGPVTATFKVLRTSFLCLFFYCSVTMENVEISLAQSLMLMGTVVISEPHLLQCA